MVGDEALVEALVRPAMGVDNDTPAQEMYQPPPASSALQTKVSWESYTEASSECVQRWWGHVTEEWAELRGHAYLLFRGPDQSEIVDGCLGRLRDLNEGRLRGRNNCCVLGPKDIGKTCVLKALVCLNSVLSSNTVSIFVDGRTIEHRLSELIVRGLEARYPQLMAKVRATLTIESWDKDLSFVVKVLRVIRRRVFVVLDEVDSVFKRPEQGHVLRELLQLGEDSKDVLVYLAAADTRARVLVTGKLPAAEHDQFKSYTGVSLKYRFLNQGALQCLCEGFQDAVCR
jgi:Cdc6-like AAA superfamily ATPase